MNVTLAPGPRTGSIRIPAAKSQAHRMLICAALSDAPSRLILSGFSEDIDATMQCLQALGAGFSMEPAGLCIRPVVLPRREAAVKLDAGESGSTLRFLLPVVAALGLTAEIRMHGRLPDRPLSPLWELLCAHGVQLRRAGDILHVSGRLTPGSFALPGNVSSQFISGLLFALPLLDGASTLRVTGTLQSAQYVAMTEQAISASGITLQKGGACYTIPGGQRYRAPAVQHVEGDWSNAAFYLCMGALSASGITVSGLSSRSLQADRAIADLLSRFGADITGDTDTITVRRGTLRGISVDAGPIPDLIPVVSVLAALSGGETRIENAARLRLKESDRLTATAQLITSLGGTVQELPDGLIITGRAALAGGSVDSCNDHRIAMSAAVAACGSRAPVCVKNSACVAKSYPAFWEDFASLKEEQP